MLLPCPRRPVAALAAASLIVACAGDAEEGEPGDVLPTIAFDEEPGLAHVHGLGVNPADEQLYVATHFGLWRVDPDRGDPERVGEHFLDLMGFTVAGEDRFLASGHPPTADELPPHLGLIESTDAGLTWRSVSLLGAVDFHALRYVDGTIYGWNSGDSTFLVSEDGGRTWDERSEPNILDLAVDPEDGDHIVATSPVRPGEMTLIESRDGGRTWEDLDAPGLARVVWTEDGGLLGVGPEGQVWTSSDGAAWRQRAAVVGFPEALSAADGTVHLAAGGALHVSRDGGDTWDVLLRYQ